MVGMAEGCKDEARRLARLLGPSLSENVKEVLRSQLNGVLD